MVQKGLLVEGKLKLNMGFSKKVHSVGRLSAVCRCTAGS